MNIKHTYTKEQLISFYKSQQLNSDLLSFSQKYPQILKTFPFQPVAYYKGADLEKAKKGILIYNSKDFDLIKTVQKQEKEQFIFENYYLTPQPIQEKADKFDFQSQVVKPVQQKKKISSKSIFSFYKWSSFRDLNDKIWYYIDKKENIRGPFSCIEMDNWHIKGLLPFKLQISFENKEKESFFLLKELKKWNFNKFEKETFKSIRRKSAPQVLSQQIAKVNGPYTSYQKDQGDFNKFSFSESKQKLEQEQDKSHIQQADKSEQDMIAKVLKLPQINKKKKK